MSKQEYDRAWYAANKARIREKLNEQNNARRAALKARIDAYKTALGCSRCPENRPACLDFHHVDPTQKKFAIGNAIRMNLCWETVLQEILKCILLCANCHRVEHFS